MKKEKKNTKKKDAKTLVQTKGIRRNKAFSSVVIRPRSNAVCTVIPTVTPFFEPSRCHVACLDVENPSRHMDLKIGAATVGGSPQLAINSLVPNDETLCLHPKDLDNTDVNWLILSQPGLARELQFSLYNPNKIDVAVFICIDGWNVNSLDTGRHDKYPKWLKPAAYDSNSLSMLSSEEICLEPFERRSAQLIPTVCPFFKPNRIRFHGRRIDNDDPVPFSVAEAYCGDRLLYGQIDGVFDQSQSYSSILKNIESLITYRTPDKIIDLAREKICGMLTDHIASDADGWGDVSWWPYFSTIGLGKHAAVIMYNPWPFRIRASVSLEGYPLVGGIGDPHGLDYYE